MTTGTTNNEMQRIYRSMELNYRISARVYDNLDPCRAQEALADVNCLRALKRKIGEKAEILEHARRCREAIADCRGSCCRWHFPRTIEPADFFCALFDLPPDKRRRLEARFQRGPAGRHQCPLLNNDGCMLDFQQRPTVCAAAYPCTMDRFWWEFLQQMKGPIAAAMGPLRARLTGGAFEPHRT